MFYVCWQNEFYELNRKETNKIVVYVDLILIL